MYKNTKKALEIILKEEYDKENPLQSFTHLNLGNQLLTVPKGETILYQGDSAEYFYILLSGHTVIMNQISFSTNDIIDYVDTVVLGSLSDNEIKLLQNVRNRYLTRRLKLYERDEHDGQYE